jgi:hypothetical protein
MTKDGNFHPSINQSTNYDVNGLVRRRANASIQGKKEARKKKKKKSHAPATVLRKADKPVLRTTAGGWRLHSNLSTLTS